MSRSRKSQKLDLKLNLSLLPTGDVDELNSPIGRFSSSSSSSSSESCLSTEAEQGQRSPSSPEAPSMVVAGCPRCLMYVMLSENELRCPKCRRAVLLNFCARSGNAERRQLNSLIGS